MYSIDWSRVFWRKPRGSFAARREPANERKEGAATGWLPPVSKTVWALGITSLFTDISSEMVASILPIYLVLHLGISPLAFGMLDGIYQGAAALVSVASGLWADRWRRHKEVAALGYGLSAGCRLLILVAGNAWGIITAIITLDRIGKGIRTAPRDSLISQSSAASGLATAFGVHRAMDAAGAMLGPVLAFALLAIMPHRFDVVFVVSFGVATIGLGAITLLVPAVAPGDQPTSAASDALKQAGQLRVRCPRCPTPQLQCGKSVSFRSAMHLLGEARFRGLVVTGVILGLATISESFIFLILQRRFDVGLSAFPLLYVATSLFTAAFSIPCGRLADGLGRTHVLLGGYGVLAAVYGVLLLPASGGLFVITAAVLLLGAFYAATDGVLTAMAAAALPLNHSGTGLAVLATATNLARLTASVLFGLLWARAGIGQATVCYLLALAVAMVSAFFVLNRPSSDAA